MIFLQVNEIFEINLRRNHNYEEEDSHRLAQEVEEQTFGKRK